MYFELTEEYERVIQRIIELARLSEEEVNSIYHCMGTKEMEAESTLVDLFEWCCRSSGVRPSAYWDYVFSQLNLA